MNNNRKAKLRAKRRENPDWFRAKPRLSKRAKVGNSSRFDNQKPQPEDV